MSELEMKVTQWEGSSVEAQRYEIPEAGPAYCLITNASYDKHTGEYKVWLYNLNSESDMPSFRYSLRTADAQNNIVPNRYAEGSMISLGTALFGKPVGIPFPDDIVGGVVLAHIVHKVYNEKTYAKIYTYSPVASDIVQSYGRIVQWSSDAGVVAPSE